MTEIKPSSPNEATPSFGVRVANSLIYRLRRMPENVVKAIARLVPLSWIEAVVRHGVSRRVDRLSAAEGLKVLFRLEDVIVRLQNLKSIDYDSGVHTKHRHTQYHDFFVDGIGAGESVLDIGCGKGEVAFDLAKKAGASVVGIDDNEAHVEWARANRAHERVEFILGQVPQDVPRRTFDVVVMSNILEHLPERSDFLRRINESVRPSRFLVRVPLFERDWRVPLRKELGVEWRLDKTHETEYTLETFADEMAFAGLTVKRQEVRWGEIWAVAVPADRPKKTQKDE